MAIKYNEEELEILLISTLNGDKNAFIELKKQLSLVADIYGFNDGVENV